MIWAILYILGVPLWAIIGGLALALWSRSKFKKQPGVFAIKIKLESGEVHGISAKWPRMASYAMWIHDVLVVHSGPALLRIQTLPVAGVLGEPEAADPHVVKRIGDNPVVFRFTLDGGAVVQMAVASANKDAAYGPFKPMASGA